MGVIGGAAAGTIARLAFDAAFATPVGMVVGFAIAAGYTLATASGGGGTRITNDEPVLKKKN